MKDLFNHLPLALRQQATLRGAMALLFLILFIAIWVGTGEFSFALPCLVFVVFLIVNTSIMLYNIINGNYVRIYGTCTSIEKTGIRRRVKSITVTHDGQQLMISVRRRLSGLSVGCGVTLYLSDKAPVYEKNGAYVIDSYYALSLEEG